LNQQRFTIFSTDGVNGVTNFKYMCSGSTVLYLWSGQSALMLLFVVCNLWIGPGFIFEYCP